MKTQTELILGYIHQFGSITPLEAMRVLGVYRLASRICDLKKMGYPIESKQEAVQTRYGKKSYVKRYSLKGGGQDGRC